MRLFLRSKTARQRREGHNYGAPSAPANVDNSTHVFSGARDFHMSGGHITGTVINNYHALPPTADDQLNRVLNLIPGSDHRAIQAVNMGKRTPGTGESFMKQELMQDFLKGKSKHRTMWGMGGPGRGKTLKAARFNKELEDMETVNPEIAVAYAYLRYDKKLSLVDILTALVREQVERHHNLAPIVEPLFQQKQREQRDLTVEELVTLLNQMASYFDQTFFSIDGLDEAPRDMHVDIVHTISRIEKANLFMTSRPLDGLKEVLTDVHLFDITTEDLDVKLFIEDELRKNIDLNNLVNGFGRDAFIERVLRNADGMYVLSYIGWAECARTINEGSTDAMKIVSDFLSRCTAFPLDFPNAFYHSPDSGGPLHVADTFELSTLLQQHIQNYPRHNSHLINAAVNSTTIKELKTPLMIACDKGDLASMRILLAIPETDVNACAKDGQAALMKVAYWGRTEVVQLLLAHPDIEADRVDSRGKSALILAAFMAVTSGHTEVIRLLLARPDVKADRVDSDGKSALLWAIKDGYTEVVQLLLARPDVEADRVDSDGQLGLLWAAEWGHTEVVQLLLARPDDKADRVDSAGKSALMYYAAAKHCDYDWRHWLLAAKKRETVRIVLNTLIQSVKIDRIDQDGKSALQLAIDKGNRHIAQRIARHMFECGLTPQYIDPFEITSPPAADSSRSTPPQPVSLPPDTTEQLQHPLDLETDIVIGPPSVAPPALALSLHSISRHFDLSLFPSNPTARLRHLLLNTFDLPSILQIVTMFLYAWLFDRLSPSVS